MVTTGNALPPLVDFLRPRHPRVTGTCLRHRRVGSESVRDKGPRHTRPGSTARGVILSVGEPDVV